MNFIKDESKAAWKYIWTFVKWLFIAGVTGIVGGFVGTAFNLSVSWATGTRMAHPWLLLLLPVSGLLIAGLYRLTKMENENTNAIIDSIHFGDKVPLMLVPAIFISTTITHLFGGSAGREGAALQIGGSLGCYIGRAFRLDDKDMRLATLCGMSAVVRRALRNAAHRDAFCPRGHKRGRHILFRARPLHRGLALRAGDGEHLRHRPDAF